MLPLPSSYLEKKKLVGFSDHPIFSHNQPIVIGVRSIGASLLICRKNDPKNVIKWSKASAAGQYSSPTLA